MCIRDRYRFTDEAWMAARSRAFDAPVNIYEMHFGSWKKDEARENGWYRYDAVSYTHLRCFVLLGYHAGAYPQDKPRRAGRSLVVE